MRKFIKLFLRSVFLLIKLIVDLCVLLNFIIIIFLYSKQMSYEDYFFSNFH